MLEVDVALGARPLIGEVLLLASKQLETFKSLVKEVKNSKLFAFLLVLVRLKSISIKLISGDYYVKLFVLV